MFGIEDFHVVPEANTLVGLVFERIEILLKASE